MENKEIICRFYDAFAQGDVETMVQCYHPDVVFTDSVFGPLNSVDAKNMWRMLLGNNKKGIKITYSEVETDGQKGSAKWVAEYEFTPTGKKVVNQIQAEFVFVQGSIIQHTDTFDLWRWSQQAMGLKGTLLGWTPFFRSSLRAKALSKLARYGATFLPKPQ